MRFNPDLLELIPADHLDAQFIGGNYQYEFEAETYWKELNEYVFCFCERLSIVFTIS